MDIRSLLFGGDDTGWDLRRNLPSRLVQPRSDAAPIGSPFGGRSECSREAENSPSLRAAGNKSMIEAEFRTHTRTRGDDRPNIYETIRQKEDFIPAGHIYPLGKTSSLSFGPAVPLGLGV